MRDTTDIQELVHNRVHCVYMYVTAMSNKTSQLLVH